jgi:hypothetical protein
MSKDSKKAVEKVQQELTALEGLPEDKIDTSDIPEVIDWSRAVRGAILQAHQEADQHPRGC